MKKTETPDPVPSAPAEAETPAPARPEADDTPAVERGASPTVAALETPDVPPPAPEQPAPPAAVAVAMPPQPAPHNSIAWVAIGVSIASLAVAGACFWQVYNQRLHIESLRGELAAQLKQTELSVGAVQVLGDQQQNVISRLQGQIGGLETRIADAADQTRALSELFQRNASTADERTLVQVEQAITIAIQQLRLANNAEAALAALAVADEELASSTQAHFQELRQALAKDSATLREARKVDRSGLAMRLEAVLDKVNSLPFAYEHSPAETPVPPIAPSEAPAAEEGWLTRAGYAVGALASEVWNEVRSMVRIERTNGSPAPELLAPAQGTYLRENVRTRLLTARLALLSHDGSTYKTDIKQARDSIARYFDTRQDSVQAVLTELDALLAQPVQDTLPNLEGTLAALRQVQARLENAVLPASATPVTEQH